MMAGITISSGKAQKMKTLHFMICIIDVYSSSGHPGARRWSPPNNFRPAKCDARFMSSSSQEAIKNNQQVSVLT